MKSILFYWLIGMPLVIAGSLLYLGFTWILSNVDPRLVIGFLAIGGLVLTVPCAVGWMASDMFTPLKRWRDRFTASRKEQMEDRGKTGANPPRELT